MDDRDRSKDQLIAELGEIRRRVSALEDSLADRDQAAEELCRVLDAAPVLVLVGGMDGYYKRVNAAFERVLGHPEHLSLSTPAFEFMHPDDRATAQAHLDRLAAGELVSDFEVRTICHDGTYKWLSWTVVPLPEKGIVYAVGYDVTERKQAEDALRRVREELEQRVADRTAELSKLNERLRREIDERRQTEEQLAIFRRFAEASVQGLGMCDLQGHITYMNPVLCRLYGEEKLDNLLGKTVFSFYPEEIQRELRQAVETILQQGQWVGEISHRMADGTLIPTIQSGFLIRGEDGRPQCLAVVVTDVSEIKKTQEALQNSEERHRTLVETSPDAVFMSDLEGRIIFASERALQLSGVNRVEELYGKNALEFIAPEDHEKLRANLKRVRELGVLRGVEFEMVRTDGTRFSGELSAAVVHDVSGKPMALTTLARDVTERKETQERLAREHRVLRQVLQAQDQERRLIAYEIHDGLAQHLTAAMMQFQSCELAERDSQEASECCKGGLRMLERSLSEARRLISGLRPPILDESGIVAAIGHLIHDVTAQGGPEVEFHSNVKFDRLEPLVENAIFRIVQESLTNAHRHSRTDRVTVELLQKGDCVEIAVADRGIGFDPDHVAERCFGLAGIRERARVLGGFAAIDTALGQGTTIRVELPIRVREASDRPNDRARPFSPGSDNRSTAEGDRSSGG
ncbi:MAG: hypothetical protein A2V70_17320 [Planctomycetes bacterium RBG_13_63_9]|nr:MAG: hypothetical protein A2V70_17320 [Planctomycetes bacterium RBG_13_63_9]